MLTVSESSSSTRSAPLFALLALLLTILVPETDLASEEARDPNTARLLALGKCDSDDGRKTSPHSDAVLLLNSGGKLITQIPRSTVKEGYGGCRGISASRDGRFFVVCDSSGEGLSMYRTSNGVKLRSNIRNYPDLVEKNLRYLNTKSRIFKDNMRRSLSEHMRERRHKARFR